ncbi:MAG: hypothetical protein D6705_05365, partial [Deltaproteobacteria bacterium]
WEVIFAPWVILDDLPCWAGAGAHHFVEGRIKICDGFYEDGDGEPIEPEVRGRALLHEMFHHTTNDFGLIRDRHPGKGCDDSGGFQAGTCYGFENALHLAEEHPNDAVTNNDNYAWFANMYGQSYLSPGQPFDPGADESPVILPCNRNGVCFPTDDTAPGCVPPPDPYAACADPSDPSLHGTLGCPCADVDIVKFEDVLKEGGYPDGAGSYLAHGVASGPGQYCEAFHDGTDVVCGKVESQGTEFPVCQACGLNTMLGCACTSNTDCDAVPADGPLRCWGLPGEGWAGSGGGICLPDDGTPAGRDRLAEMPWFCVDDCEAIAPGPGWPMGCVFDQSPSLGFAHGECVDMISCEGELAGVCEESTGRCDQDADACEVECLEAADCAAQGFPPYYVCNAATHSTPRCVPPACANPKSAVFGGPYCALFE